MEDRTYVMPPSLGVTRFLSVAGKPQIDELVERAIPPTGLDSGENWRLILKQAEQTARSRGIPIQFFESSGPESEAVIQLASKLQADARFATALKSATDTLLVVVADASTKSEVARDVAGKLVSRTQSKFGMRLDLVQNPNSSIKTTIFLALGVTTGTSLPS